MGTITITDTFDVLRNGSPAGRLTPFQARALICLHAAGHRPIPNEAIYDQVLPMGEASDPAACTKAAMVQIRKVIGRDVVERVRSCGYRLCHGWKIMAGPSAPVVVRVPDDLLAPLARAADMEGRTVEEMVVEAVREFLG